jgi:ubiquinone/menaquinone biosynthesis C-methylase UbiE
MADETKIKAEWDLYWEEKNSKKTGNNVYDKFAAVYRKLIIKKILNHFTFKYFKKNDQVLHAGCGSGQVDMDLTGYVNITALDISDKALKIYKDIHGDKVKIVEGSIFKLPFDDHTFDGIYNLGVMEHFTEPEIQEILKEFKRVLKPNGTMVILWPPTFGLTVFVLDSAHFIMNKIFRMNIKLHPDEISRIRSKKYAYDIFEQAGFAVEDYYFGSMDLFTQVVIVAKNK